MDYNKRCDCSFSESCNCIGLLVGIVVAILTGVLFAFGIIQNIEFVTFVTFYFAVFSLIFLVIGLFLAALIGRSPLAECLCKKTKCLLAGIIGTIVSFLILSAFLFLGVTIVTIILVAINAFFVTLMFIEIVLFLICIAKKLCCRD